jgi:hypothetical protein
MCISSKWMQEKISLHPGLPLYVWKLKTNLITIKLVTNNFSPPKVFCHQSCNNQKGFRLSYDIQAFSIGDPNPFLVTICKTTKNIQSPCVRGPKSFDLQKFGNSKFSITNHYNFLSLMTKYFVAFKCHK